MQIKITFYLITFIVNFFCINAVAQEVSSPEDTLTCNFWLQQVKSLSNAGKYDKAIKIWNDIYKNCKYNYRPIYNRGIDLLEYSIKNTKDEKAKKELVDSMMNLYEERIKYFGQEGYVRGRQGVDLLKHDQSQVQKIHALLNKSVELQGLESEPAVILCLMQASVGMYLKGFFSDEEYDAFYQKCISNIEKQLTDKKRVAKDDLLEQAYLGINHAN